jgi:hypothetical protein
MSDIASELVALIHLTMETVRRSPGHTQTLSPQFFLILSGLEERLSFFMSPHENLRPFCKGFLNHHEPPNFS